MQKPVNWDSIQAPTGERYKQLPAGGYVCKIFSASVDHTMNGNERLNIKFDIQEGEYKNYFTEQFDKRIITNANASWNGTYRQITEGEASEKFYKGMITAIENSNPGYKWDFDETTLKGKLFGGVFGFEEWMNNQGKIMKSIKCRFVRSVDEVRKGIEPPEIKKLSGANQFGSTVQNDEPFIDPFK